MTAGPEFLNSGFDAATLHKTDFWELKIEDFTLSKINHLLASYLPDILVCLVITLASTIPSFILYT